MARLESVKYFYISFKYFFNDISPTKLNYAKFMRKVTGSGTCQYSTETSSNDDVNSYVVDLIKEESFKNLVPRSIKVSDMPHQVYIIHPHIKWGEKKKTITTPQLQLNEAISLIKTLPNWAVIGSKVISLMSFEKKTFFNSGQLESVKAILKDEMITALFVNAKSLKVQQLLFLEKYLNVPIFDRYSIIINIFKVHAHTKEAKLQVALAEIPYIHSRICGIHENEATITKNVGISSGETFIEKRFNLLKEQRRKITKAIANLRQKRDMLRNRRKELEFPIVAVVGYTNVGKTSLIKCLTKEIELTPENKLFATLDVTAHAVLLPHNIKALLIDTIGFITDIPTDLMEPFVATLEDALLADVIIHVKDVSHPDHLCQELEVVETLKKLKISDSGLKNIITVGNKCDKKNLLSVNDNIHLVSCAKHTGIEKLKETIADAIIQAKDMMKIRIRVTNGGAEYQWLVKGSAVSQVSIDKNPQYVLLDVFITKAKFNKFKHEFIE